MQGVTPSNKDGFSLSSGDFPSLGSEKDSPGKNTDSLGERSFFELTSFFSLCKLLDLSHYFQLYLFLTLNFSGMPRIFFLMDLPWLNIMFLMALNYKMAF